MRSATRVGAVLATLGLLVVAAIVLGGSNGGASWVLGAWEALLTCAGLAACLAVVVGRASGYWMILPLVLAVTVAQPFGIRVEPVAPTAAALGGEEDPGRVESIDVLGMPLARFRLESADKPPAYREGDYPTHELKARSWLPPLLLINATPIVDMCGVVTDPCWEPDSADANRAPGSSGIALFELRGRWHVRTTSTGDASLTGRPVVKEWQLSYGVASWAGVAYWALLALALAVAGVRRQSR